MNKRVIYLKAVYKNGFIEFAAFTINIPIKDFIQKMWDEVNKREPIGSCVSIEPCSQMEYVAFSIAHQCQFRVQMFPN